MVLRRKKGTREGNLTWFPIGRRREMHRSLFASISQGQTIGGDIGQVAHVRLELQVKLSDRFEGMDAPFRKKIGHLPAVVSKISDRIEDGRTATSISSLYAE